jgi:hypothetical protein
MVIDSLLMAVTGLRFRGRDHSTQSFSENGVKFVSVS